MVPALSLDYSSQNSDGLEGLGWSLDGIPSITRCARNFAQDNVHGGVNYDSNDRFCLEGQRLVAITSGTYGQDNMVYRTENDGFSKIVSHGTAGSGPAYFEVYTKAGQIMFFGNSVDSQVLPVKADGSGTLASVRVWAMNELLDSKGNYLTVTYNCSAVSSVCTDSDRVTNGQAYPLRIDYTANDAAGLTSYSSVRFNYESRSDQTPTYQAGAVQMTTQLLSNIKTYFGSSVVSDYQLTYASKASPSQHDELSSIKLCDASGVCLSPTSFGWQGSKNVVTLTGVPNSLLQGKKIKYGNGTFYTNPNMHAVDFNGDGLTDLISELHDINTTCPSTGEIYLFDSSTNSFVTADTTATYISPSFPYENGPFCIFGDPSTSVPANALIDLNADGIMDVAASNTLLPYRAMMNNELGTAFNQITGPGSPVLYVGDYNGDGIDDFNSDSDTTNFLGNGNGTFTSTSMPSISPYGLLTVADFNGDGCADWLSQGSGSGESGIIFSPYCATSSARIATPYWDPSAWSVAIGDFNGDGVADILAANATSGTLYLSSGTALVAQSFVVPSGWGKYEIVTGDWNGDGKTDIALIADGSSGHYGSGHDHLIYLSTGTGFVQATDSSGDPVTISNSDSTVGVGVGDFNNDGAPDLWLQQASGDMEYLFSYVPELMTSVNNGIGIQTTVTYDRINKNQPLYKKCSNGTYSCGDSYPIQDVDGPLYVVSRVDSSNGLGSCAPPSMTNCASSTYNYAGAQTDLSGRGFLGFSQVAITDVQTGIVQTTSYEMGFPFTGLIASQTKVCPAAICGALVTLNSTTNAFEKINLGVSTDGVTRWFVALQNSVIVSNDLNGAALPTEGTTYTYDCDTGGTSICAGASPTGFGDATQIVSCEWNTATRACLSSGWSKTTTNGYADDVANWHLGRLIAANVDSVIGSFGHLTRHTSYCYELSYVPSGTTCPTYSNPTSGLLTSEVVEPGASDPTATLDTEHRYDAFGNETIAKTTGCVWISPTSCSNSAPISARETNSAFDTTTYNAQFATTITNALGQAETWDYNQGFGVPTKHVGPNDLPPTTWHYDTFGRKTLETRPDGNQTATSYTYCTGLPTGETCPTNAVFDVIVEPENTSGTINGAVSITYYDGLSRVVARDLEGFDGPESACTGSAHCWIRTATPYDVNGRIQQASRPYFISGSAVWTIFTYDTIGRVTKALYPDSTYTNYGFNGLTTTVTNYQGQMTTTVKNDEGQIASVADANSEITYYVYDAVGELLTITDPSGNVTTNSYDMRGRKTMANDPDMGSWSYVYDGFGELYSQTDANAQVTTLTYDALGRMLSRNEPDMSSSWVYDSAAHGIGHLASATTASGYSRTLTYDLYGRPAGATLTIAETGYNYSTSYDANGRISTVQYPSGFTALYGYTALGYLDQVSDNGGSGRVFWTADTRDAEMHLLTETQGNGVLTTNMFDTDTGRPVSIAAGASSSVANETFQFDSLGNLKTRTWLNDSGTTVRENACYDNLNRVTSTLVVPSGDACTGSGAVTVSYDAIGNITSKSDICSTTNCMQYGQDGPGPHALTKITGTYNGVVNPSFAYDGNGNMTGGGGRSVTNTSFNMAGSITDGASEDTITYDTEHMRITQVATGSNAGTTTYLNDPVSGTMSEKFVAGSASTWRDYIMADGHMVAVRNLGNGAPPTWGASTWSSFHWTAQSTTIPVVLYFTLDHLGSIAVVTDSSGIVLERDNYDAWGKRRGADGSAAPCGSITSTTTRGFTGQEMMDSICLINFNARVYDPSLGRFMSADPTTETVYNLQILNRYSYVGNNPLSLTDPTGLCFLGCFWHSSIFTAVLDIVAAVVLQDYALPALEDFAAGEGTSAGLVGINAGLSGGIAGLVTTGKFSSALSGAFQAELFFRAGDVLQSNPSFLFGSPTASTFVAHGLVGGLSSAVSGGRFASGFLAAGVGSLADIPDLQSNSLALNTAEHAVFGGAGSILGGGKFANGAVTGAFGYLFNSLAHSYGYREQVCQSADPACSTRAVWDQLLHNAYPGQDPSTTVENGGKYAVFGMTQAGAITVTVDEATMTVTNTTEASHDFCCGSVILQVIGTDEGVDLSITGSGTNTSYFWKYANYAASVWFPTVIAPNITTGVDQSYSNKFGHWPVPQSVPPGSNVIPPGPRW